MIKKFREHIEYEYENLSIKIESINGHLVKIILTNKNTDWFSFNNWDEVNKFIETIKKVRKQEINE